MFQSRRFCAPYRLNDCGPDAAVAHSNEGLSGFGTMPMDQLARKEENKAAYLYYFVCAFVAFCLLPFGSSVSS